MALLFSPGASDDETMPSVPHGLEVLTLSECAHLLGSHTFGRVALSVNVLPVIMPVHYAMLDESPVFRTDPGAKLMAASAGRVLCLEVDESDPLTHTGWSVMVTGPARVLESAAELQRAKELPLRPWVGRGDIFVQIEPSVVSGRRIAARRIDRA